MIPARTTVTQQWIPTDEEGKKVETFVENFLVEVENFSRYIEKMDYLNFYATSAQISADKFITYVNSYCSKRKLKLPFE